MKLQILLLFIFTVYLSGCYYDNAEEIHPKLDEVCDTNNVVITYASNISVIMQNSCGSQSISCHSSSSSSSGVDLNSYRTVRDQGENGDLMATILHESGVSPMPEGGGQLSECKINLIRAWINNNYPQ